MEKQPELTEGHTAEKVLESDGTTAENPEVREDTTGEGDKEVVTEEEKPKTNDAPAEADEQHKWKGTGVVLRRETAKPDVIQLKTYPKRARPMSMPPGRPGKLPKPGAPAPVAPGKRKLPKPGKPPTRPAQGPLRPAQPRAAPRKAQMPVTPTTPVDPNVPPELPPRPAPGHVLYKYVCTEPHGVALTTHDPTDATELPYEADDVIELIERVDRDWFYARNADLEMCEGMIPARDLRVVRKLPGESTVSGFEEGPCAVASFTFRGKSMDELSFKEGELIMLKARVGKEWLRGKLVGGQEGIFPRSYVEIVEDLPAGAEEEAPAPTQSQSTVEIHGPHCVALYEFTAGSPGELSLSVGDTVELLARAGADWLRGRLGGQEGIFPSQFVEVREDLPPDDGQSDSWAKTLFDFEGQDGELSFKAGERVRVVSRVNDDWVEGEREDGLRGMLPASFVDKLPADLPPKSDATEPTAVAKPVTGKCEALFDFTAENAGEMSFKTGDTIVTLEWVNEEWVNGRIGAREGIFPVAFVKVLEELPKATTTQKESGML
jgi:hypothetical protein